MRFSLKYNVYFFLILHSYYLGWLFLIDSTSSFFFLFFSIQIMADSSQNCEKTVRQKVLENLTVPIKYGDELRNGISECLEQVLNISRDNLSNYLLNKFDEECRQMYDYFPRRMKKISRNKSEVIRKSRVFFDKKVELIEAPIVADLVDVQVPAPSVEAPNVDTPSVKAANENVGFL